MRLTPKSSLRLNAWFSLGSGLFLLVSPNMVGTWLGVSIDGWLRVLGAILISHAAIIAGMQSALGVDRAIRINLLLIAPYPLVMLGLVVSRSITTDLGQSLVLADGAIVAAIGVLHVVGLRSGQTADRSAAREYDDHGV